MIIVAGFVFSSTPPPLSPRRDLARAARKNHHRRPRAIHSGPPLGRRYACRTLDRRDPEASDLVIGDHRLSFEREDSGAVDAEQAIPAFPQPRMVGGG